MCKIICVSNRLLCIDDFIKRIQRICDIGIPVILREKDLSENEYYELLIKINRKNIIAHKYINAASKYESRVIHLPLSFADKKPNNFDYIGFSVHSVSEAKKAVLSGAAYITAGHIFHTECKPDRPPKGIQLLKNIKSETNIPLFALGGITPQNFKLATTNGADGICIMSGFMQCANPEDFANAFHP